MKRDRTSVFLGIFLVIGGIILILNNMGIVDFSFWQYFYEYWPFGLILAGIAIIYKRRDVGFAILFITFLLLISYGVGHVASTAFSGDWWNNGINCVKGSGNMINDTRELPEFSEVSVSNGAHVYLEKGIGATARVEAEDNIMEFVKTEIRGDELHVYLDRCTINSKPVNVYVTFENIDSLEVQTAGRIIGNSIIKSEDIKISSSSAGNIDVEVEAIDLTLESSTVGSITVKGKTDKLYADASSSGKINAFELVAEDVYATVSSAGIAQVYASDKFNADASSGGKVQYKGNPPEVEVDSSSGGTVQKE